MKKTISKILYLIPATVLGILLLSFLALAFLQVLQGYGLLLEDIIRIELVLNESEDGLFQIVSAVATVVIAGLTALAAWQVAERDRRVLESKQRSARALAILGLSDTTKVAEHYAVSLAKIWEECQNQPDTQTVQPSSLLRAGFDGVKDVAGIITTLRDAIEYSSEARAEQLINVLTDLQVSHSRIGGLQADVQRSDCIVATINIESYIIRCLKLYANASNQLPWARNGDDDCHCTTEQSACNLLFSTNEFARIHRVISNRIASNNQ